MFFVSDKVLVKRLLRAMRITTVIMLVGCMHVAAKTSSQVITFSGKNVPLKIVFAEIRKQAGFTVAYNADLISVKDVVTVNAVNTPLEEFLDQMLTPQRIDYLIKRNTIFLSRSVNHATEEVQPREVDEKIEGRVVDENGQPLIGATVKGKRSHAIAVTNENGQFSIKIASGEILICTYVGHDTREIRLTDAMLTRGSVTIALTKSITALDEVEIVNKGYYAESKRFLTGNVSKVTAKEIEKQPVSNPLAALMGRVPGLQIIQQTGVPGGNFQVRIRGQNSLRGKHRFIGLQTHATFNEGSFNGGFIRVGIHVKLRPQYHDTHTPLHVYNKRNIFFRNLEVGFSLDGYATFIGAEGGGIGYRTCCVQPHRAPIR